MKAAKAELQSLYVTLSEKPPRLEREAAQARISHLQAQLDKHALAMEAQKKLAALPDFVRELATRPIPEQAITALRMGIAQAVNDLPIDVTAVRHLDGTQEGVKAFLAERKLADATEKERLLQGQAQLHKTLAANDTFGDMTVEQQATHVQSLEMQLREQVKAADGDEAAIDDFLAESNAEMADLPTQAKMLKGLEMCMMRNG